MISEDYEHTGRLYLQGSNDDGEETDMPQRQSCQPRFDACPAVSHTFCQAVRGISRDLADGSRWVS